MIDVCYNNLEFEDEWICPVEEFRQISTIENINKTLEYNGILTMNIIHKSKDINLHQELLELYKTVFKHCELASDNNYRMKNQILTCFNSKQGFHSASNYNKILSKYSDYVSWI
ncbi:unnamed protein product [Caenorhabditis angaria]|uniref:Uncharacterized protein n=1 Tax=Caenorhabditis angaria TaxID=860376 RepID=A0A9P1MVD0_9PELO|nr:unnamed protein product [Caenorhabditis angaria]